MCPVRPPPPGRQAPPPAGQHPGRVRLRGSQKDNHLPEIRRVEDLDQKLVLSDGAYGRVMLAEHRATHKRYALKVMSMRLLVQKEQQKHVLDEQHLLRSTVACPFIITLVNSFKDHSRLYLALELAPGGDLHSLLHRQRDGCFSEKHARFYVAQVILALEFLHRRYIVYRDLKPENIVIMADGYVKLADFGFAKVLERGSRTFTYCGTKAYMAPELALRCPDGYDHKVDLWSLGVLAYELVHGFISRFIRAYVTRFIQNGVGFHSCFFSAQFKEVIKKLLKDDPTQRANIEALKKLAWFTAASNRGNRAFSWKNIAGRRVDPKHIPFIPNTAEELTYFPEKCDLTEECEVTGYSSHFAEF